MKSICTPLLLALLLSFDVSAQLAAGFTQTKIADGLDPTRLAIADDGRIFVSEKNGKIRVIKDGVLQAEPYLQIEVDQIDERGLNGFVLDPNFGTNQYFYVYYAVPGNISGGNFNRLSRFKGSGNFADPNSELVLIDFNRMAWQVHNGSSMVFGKDGKLYIAAGDGAIPSSPPNHNYLLGKVHRINGDGTIPEDNPFYAVDTGTSRSIYAVGFRNPFSMAINHVNGQIAIGDVGYNTYEEISILGPAKNFGWSTIEGPLLNQTPPPNYQEPLYYYHHQVGGCAITGLAYYTPEVYQFPERFHNKLFFTDYCRNYIRVLDPATGEIQETLAGDMIAQAITGLITAPNGSLYYLSRGTPGNGQEGNSSSSIGSVWRIDYTGSGVPYISQNPASQFHTTGETATFSVVASGTAPLAFQWKKDDVNIPGATSAQYTTGALSLTDNGASYTCRVSNGEGAVISQQAILTVTANTRPVVTIELPDEALLYRAGDTLICKGGAMDQEDGQLAATALTWSVDFHHNTHIHPALANVRDTDSTGFVIPIHGETSPSVWYRIHLTATDSEGLVQSTFKDVFPKKSVMTFVTNPPGLNIALDGQALPTPGTVTGVVNAKRSIYAAPVIYDDQYMYRFLKWSDGLADNTIEITTPENDSTIVATYSQLALATGSGLTGKYFNQAKTFNSPPNLVRVDENIDFDWSIGSPDPAINTNVFTAQWTGFIQVPLDGVYTFYLTSDDGSKLFIDNNILIDNWAFNDFLGGSEKSASMPMIAGKYYRVRMEYYETTSISEIRLSWSSNEIPKSIIPKNQFSLINPFNTPPFLSFLAPADDFRFTMDSAIVVKGTTTDLEDGDIDSHTLRWWVDLHHTDHVHHTIAETTNLDSLVIHPELEPGDGANVFYRVFMASVDQDGAVRVDSIDIQPKTVTVSIDTSPSGFPVIWDSKEIATPALFEEIKGKDVTVLLPATLSTDSANYILDSWVGEILPSGSDSDSLRIPGADISLTAELNAIPKIYIVNISDSDTFAANELVSVVAEATDLEDGDFKPDSVVWSAERHEDGEVTQFISSVNEVDSLSFLPQINKNSNGNFFYRVIASVTDSKGVTTSTYADISPRTSEVKVKSDPDGIPFFWDNEEMIGPFTRTLVEGTNHRIEPVASTQVGVVPYNFLKWNAPTIITTNPMLFTVPAKDTTLTAIYTFIVGIEGEANTLSVYPNPVTDQLYIRWSGVSTLPRSFAIFNSIGQEVTRGSGSGEEVQAVPFSPYSTGAYFLRLNDGGVTKMVRVIKQ